MIYNMFAKVLVLPFVDYTDSEKARILGISPAPAGQPICRKSFIINLALEGQPVNLPTYE